MARCPGMYLGKNRQPPPKEKKKVDLASITTTWDVSLKDPAIIVILPLGIVLWRCLRCEKIHRSDPPRSAPLWPWSISELKGRNFYCVLLVGRKGDVCFLLFSIVFLLFKGDVCIFYHGRSSLKTPFGDFCLSIFCKTMKAFKTTLY